jgi:outer membrane protein TolC
MRIFSCIFFLFLYTNLFSQDTAVNHTTQDSLTIEDAIKYAIDNNYGVIISKNAIEIGKINNNWANAGAYPIISANAAKTIGSNNIQQKLNSGSEINKNGSVSQNLNAGIGFTWRIFDGYRMFATKKRLEELERNGEYAFRKNVNETVYNVIVAYYNIVKLKQQSKAIIEQINLYTDRLKIADLKYQIGSGAKYEMLQAQVDLNEQLSNNLTTQNSINLAKTNLYNIIGKVADTTFKVADTIMINSLPDISTVQNKIKTQNPDVLLANSNLEILYQSRREINSGRLPAITLNGNYNFVRSSNGAGLTLYNQTYGPSGSIGIGVPIFNGGLIKKQLRVSDIQIKDQRISLDQVRNNINTSVTNSYINYQNALNIISLEKTNLSLAEENVFIATQRFKALNITSVELRQVQISYIDAENRLYNALYQAKLAEAEINLVTGEISNL